MRLAIACDHGGFALKMKLIALLPANQYEIHDFGCYDSASMDYPDVAIPAAEAVASGDCDKGLLICTTGVGMSICANKVRGVRCALCTNEYMAEMTRRHNDANMLALGANTVDEKTALRILQCFMSTPFEGGRHSRRIGKISEYEENH
ncbi:MAG: ribose 5-phosphate isomerase B [Clostridia bacterium]|nr:ribose 5-phosphate isomerase B [Clostridia bacterium]